MRTHRAAPRCDLRLRDTMRCNVISPATCDLGLRPYKTTSNIILSRAVCLLLFAISNTMRRWLCTALFWTEDSVTSDLGSDGIFQTTADHAEADFEISPYQMINHVCRSTLFRNIALSTESLQRARLRNPDLRNVVEESCSSASSCSQFPSSRRSIQSWANFIFSSSSPNPPSQNTTVPRKLSQTSVRTPLLLRTPPPENFYDPHPVIPLPNGNGPLGTRSSCPRRRAPN